MKLEPIPSVKIARKVLDILSKLLKADTQAKEGMIEHYQNGREHGFTVADYHAIPPRAVTFAQERRSDQIVVYLDNISYQSLTETAWKTAKCFGPDESYQAAEYCAAHLLAKVENKV